MASKQLEIRIESFLTSLFVRGFCFSHALQCISRIISCSRVLVSSCRSMLIHRSYENNWIIRMSSLPADKMGPNPLDEVSSSVLSYKSSLILPKIIIVHWVSPMNPSWARPNTVYLLSPFKNSSLC